MQEEYLRAYCYILLTLAWLCSNTLEPQRRKTQKIIYIALRMMLIYDTGGASVVSGAFFQNNSKENVCLCFDSVQIASYYCEM